MSMYGSIHSHFEDNYDATTNMELAIDSYIAEGCKKVAATGHGVFTEFEDLRYIVKHKEDDIKKYNKKAEEAGKELKAPLDFEIIPGIEAYFGEDRAHMILIAKDYEGYVSLSRAISDSAFNYDIKKKIPVMDLDILRKNISKGHVYCTSACIAGPFARPLGLTEFNLRKKLEKVKKGLNAEDLTKRDIFETYRFFKTTPKPLKKIFNEANKIFKKTGDDSYLKEFDRMSVNYDNALKEMAKIEEAHDIKDLEKAYKLCNKKEEEISALENELRNYLSDENKAREHDKNVSLYRDLEEIFGKENFFFEIQNHDLPQEKTIYNNIIDFAIEVGNPNFIASNDIHIGVTKRHPEYETELLKRNVEKQRRFKKYYPETADDREYCIKNDEELTSELKKTITDHGTLTADEIITSSIKNIEGLLSNCHVEFVKENHYPKFCEDENAEFERLVRLGMKNRFPNGYSKEYADRLEGELDVIKIMGYAGYHLIVQDYLAYGRLLGFLPNDDIPNAPLSIEELNAYIDEKGYSRIGIGIGPGRGSAAGSLCCYALGITEVDPIKHGLLFERFLNVERVSMPDIDSDIKTDIREKMVEYCQNKYGFDNTCRVITKLYNASKDEEEEGSEENNKISAGNVRLAARYLASKNIFEASVDKDFNITAEDEELDFTSTLSKEEEKLIESKYLNIADNISKDYQVIGKRKIEEDGEERDATANEIFSALKDKYESDPALSQKSLADYMEVLTLAKNIDGIFTGYGQHAAGVIISKDPIRDILPLYYNPVKDNYSTQYVYKQAEDKGLLKMDFLGLKNLDIITEIIKTPTKKEDIDDRLQSPAEVEKILNDPNIYKDIFSTGRTQGIFQFEKPAMKTYLKNLQPESFEDAVLLNAANRPGPQAYIPEITAWKWKNKFGDDYESYSKKIRQIYPASKEANQKFYDYNGEVLPTPPKTINLNNEALADILKNTYGCPIYQEQIMQIFQRMAGYSLGGADLVRRAMSKKDLKTLVAEKQAFIHGDESRHIDGAIKKQGLTEEEAELLFEQMMPFAKYGFNKSHAVAYTQVALYTAYLKEYHTADFYRSSLNAVKENAEMDEFISEMEDFGIEMLPPDLEHSSNFFTVKENDGKKNIRFGLAMIKGLGEVNFVPTKSIMSFMWQNPNVPISTVRKFCELGMFEQRWEYKGDDNKNAIEKELCSSNRQRLVDWYDRYAKDYKALCDQKRAVIEGKKDMLNATEMFNKSQISEEEYTEISAKYDKLEEKRKSLAEKFNNLILVGPQTLSIDSDGTVYNGDMETFYNPNANVMEARNKNKSTPLNRLRDRYFELTSMEKVFDYKEDLKILRASVPEKSMCFTDLKDKALPIKCLILTMPSPKYGDKNAVSYTKNHNAYRKVKLMDSKGNILDRRITEELCDQIERSGKTIVDLLVQPESGKYFFCKEAVREYSVPFVDKTLKNIKKTEEKSDISTLKSVYKEVEGLSEPLEEPTDYSDLQEDKNVICRRMVFL